MLKPHGTLRLKKNPQHRSNTFRSAVARTILQSLTVGAAIVTYHYFVMTQLVNDAYVDGRIDGHKCARLTASIESASIPFPEVCKGWRPQWTPTQKSD